MIRVLSFYELQAYIKKSTDSARVVIVRMLQAESARKGEMLLLKPDY